jgi:hypothetical protein
LKSHCRSVLGKRAGGWRRFNQVAPASLLSALIVSLITLAAGCQTQSASSGGEKGENVTNQSQRDLSSDKTLATDPCAVRLHDIGGAMLLYYAINKSLPARLEDISPLADADAPLNFTCPVSGLPYEYMPGGLILEGRRRRIVVCDPTPAHDGKRWCLFMANETRPGAAQSVEVLPLPEETFAKYHPPEP